MSRDRVSAHTALRSSTAIRAFIEADADLPLLLVALALGTPGSQGDDPDGELVPLGDRAQAARRPSIAKGARKWLYEASASPGRTNCSSGLTRREFIPLLGAAAIVTAAPRTVAAAQPSEPGAVSRFVYVGTYTAPDVPPGGTHPSTAIGISVFRMSPRDGELTLVETVSAENPSFLALDPTLTHLYSVNENLAGRVSAYAIDPANGRLAFLNTQSANGKHTTHLSVHPSGRYLLAANYTSGDFPVFRIESNGSIGAHDRRVRE